MNPLRVLHVVPHLDRSGGYQRQALALARHQARQRAVLPMVLTHAVPGRTLFEREAFCEIHRLPAGLRRYHPASWWRRHGGRIDVVHVHALHKLSGQVVALAAAAGVPSVVKVATTGDVAMFARPGAWQQALDGDEDAPRGLRWQLMARMAFARLRRANLFVAVNEAIAAELAAHGLPYVRIPNGVDGEHFRPPTTAERAVARGTLRVAPGTQLVAYVGRLATRKDLGTLLEAFARLPAQATLLLAGEGPARAALEAQIHAGGLATRVRLLGELPDVRSLLHAADVFVNPSLREGLPNAVLEALACGVPCVLSAISGHREIAASAGEEVRLFAPGDGEALASGVGRILREGAQPRAGANLASGAGQHFLLSRCANEWHRAYETVRPTEDSARG